MLLTRTHINEAQNRLGVVFKDLHLLETAFVHRSFLNEQKDDDLVHNERLEFLGDAVIELALTQYLYKRLPDAPEGKMTKIRGMMASYKFIAPIAEEVGLDKFLLMSKGERKPFDRHERSRAVIMANAFEAVVGAMYLDRGMGVVELFLGKYYFPKLPEVIQKHHSSDPKSCFQEIAQERWKMTPRYEVIEESGPAHDRKFVVVALGIDGERVGEGSGASKADAEVAAATDALQKKFAVVLTS